MVALGQMGDKLEMGGAAGASYRDRSSTRAWKPWEQGCAGEHNGSAGSGAHSVSLDVFFYLIKKGLGFPGLPEQINNVNCHSLVYVDISLFSKRMPHQSSLNRNLCYFVVYVLFYMGR